ncbi:hypothetical protein K503DRAFT_582097 [Rhizopogon vinicolor AM-OR11-026]|uniref:Uncharacterized protein n=1 Tax=Rhizopogon vinicolor AM-OR11-026 TaxID=1314800 RepID=A0A1B7NH34_9AGAM|nr:hypothetical protein K503DRAFT_582097 [Rhizopogon vinicolor AM-OR11-026]
MTLPASLDDVTPRTESIRALRSRKDSLACIPCLPPEILAAVFKHIVEDIKSHSSAYRPPPRAIVTHVCRHWRQVALECQSLCAIINLTSAYWIRVFLERSKKTALVVTRNASTLPRDSFEQVLSQLPRIKVLQLQSYPSDADRALNYLSLQPAPLLQNFQVHGHRGQLSPNTQAHSRRHLSRTITPTLEPRAYGLHDQLDIVYFQRASNFICARNGIYIFYSAGARASSKMYGYFGAAYARTPVHHFERE